MENTKPQFTFKSKWAGRFIWAAVVEGFFAVVATVLTLDPLQ
jgi:hypothetical protein